jgi:signal peptidase II
MSSAKRARNATSLRVPLVVFGLALGLDQLSKLWALAFAPRMADLTPAELGTSLVFMAFAPNAGVVFGFAPEQGHLSGIVLLPAMIAAMWLSLGAMRPYRNGALALFALIMAGVSGNQLDRLRLGAVTDFIGLRLAHDAGLLLNVADLAIGIGSIALLALFACATVRRRPTCADAAASLPYAAGRLIPVALTRGRLTASGRTHTPDGWVPAGK